MFALVLRGTIPVPPNIVFVLTDDQAPWAFGSSVRDGQYDNVPVAYTPNMDRLAKEGAMFTHFFCATPVCSPARAAIATGRYASELGIKDFIPSPDHVLFDAGEKVALDPNTSVTFAEVLQSSGYHTGLVGKWHLGDWTAKDAANNHPTNHGFDYFMGLTSGGESPVNPNLEKDGQVKQFKGLTTDILTDHAIDFLETASTETQPFLLCLHTRAPHGRWLPVAPEDMQPYEDIDPAIPNFPDLDQKRVKRDMRQYLASTSGVDRNLGRLLQTLDQLKLSKRTVVIFTSDHGYNMGHNGIVHKGNGIWATRTKPPGKTHNGVRVISDKYRPNLYDLSLRVPALARWPGVIKPGTRIEDTASHLDLFPTLVEIAKADHPSDLPLRGNSLVPLLQGERPSSWKQDLYTQYSMINYAVATLRSYRTQNYKLIRDFHNQGCDEFFDLRSDPSESNNLINDPRPEIQTMIKAMDTKLHNRANQIGDSDVIHSHHIKAQR